MSRWAPKRKSFKDPIIWVNKPKRLYSITTAQGSFYIKSDYLDYKKTVADLKRKGYTNINIAFIGYDVTF